MPNNREFQVHMARLRQDVRRHLACADFVDPPAAIGQLVDAIAALCDFSGGAAASIVAPFLREAAKAVPR